ncbi:MAG: SDR family oxidoreductase [Bacilli bacterium]|nr:SDR family oxidoreductase [Bacilli bacterium]
MATKAAVVGITKTWAKEFGRKGINVNAVVFGFIMTDMVRSMRATSWIKVNVRFC